MFISQKPHQEDGVFRAQPILVNENDLVLNDSNLNHSITSDEDFYQLPINEADKLNSSSPLSSLSISTKVEDTSLTYSEDSDTTRIYDLNTRETKLVIPSSPEKDIERTRNFEVPIEAYKSDYLYRQVKPLPAETLEFFAPKKTQSLYIKRMEELAAVPQKVQEPIPSIDVPEIVLDLAPTVVEEDESDVEVQISSDIEEEKTPEVQNQEFVKTTQFVSIIFL